jgi:hypothetical protein
MASASVMFSSCPVRPRMPASPPTTRIASFLRGCSSSRFAPACAVRPDQVVRHASQQPLCKAECRRMCNFQRSRWHVCQSANVFSRTGARHPDRIRRLHTGARHRGSQNRHGQGRARTVSASSGLPGRRSRPSPSSAPSATRAAAPSAEMARTTPMRPESRSRTAMPCQSAQWPPLLAPAAATPSAHLLLHVTHPTAMHAFSMRCHKPAYRPRNRAAVLG